MSRCPHAYQPHRHQSKNPWIILKPRESFSLFGHVPPTFLSQRCPRVRESISGNRPEDLPLFMIPSSLPWRLVIMELKTLVETIGTPEEPVVPLMDREPRLPPPCHRGATLPSVDWRLSIYPKLASLRKGRKCPRSVRNLQKFLPKSRFAKPRQMT